MRWRMKEAEEANDFEFEFFDAVTNIREGG